MFKVVKPDSLLWPVSVDVPLDDGSGGSEKQEFKMRFKYLETGDLNQVLAKLSVAKDADSVADYILAWDGLADQDGKALLFSEENRQALMKIPFMVVAINKAFIDCQMGAERKN